MSWSELSPPPPNAWSVARVKAGVTLRGVFLSLSATLIEEFGIKKDTRFRVLIGAGEAAGRLKIVPDATGPFALSARGKCCNRLVIGRVDGAPLKAKVVPCRFEFAEGAAIKGRVLIVTLPWEVSAEKRKTDKTPPQAPGETLGTTLGAKLGAVTLPPRGPLKDITGGLMGDPAPGRSAAAQGAAAQGAAAQGAAAKRKRAGS